MKSRSHLQKRSAMAALLLFGSVVLAAPSALALDIGGFTNAVNSLTGAVQAGTQLVGSFLNIFGGGGGVTSVPGGAGPSGVPNVPNGSLLPGPGNASYGISYVRDVFVPNLTNWVVAAVLAGSVIVVIAGGIMFVFGGQNQEMANKARDTVTWACIGMAVTVLAYALVRIVITINFLG